MLYVSDIDTTGRAVVRIKDSENSEYELSFFETELMSELKECSIVPQTVVGLFKYGSQLYITPVHGVELQVVGLLGEPYFHIVDKLGSNGARPFRSYGLYNFCLQENAYSDDVKPFSVAKLLLETCGDVWQAEDAKSRIETTREYISICVEDSEYQSVYLRFGISDYTQLQRAYLKYKVLKKAVDAGSTRLVRLPIR